MADAKAFTSTPDAAAGNPVDVTTVTTGAGTVDRQCVSIGDPATGGNRVVVSAAGKILVTPDSVALPANQSVNVAQLAATATDTNSGSKSAGTLRVVIATDQPQLTNKLLVTPDSVALPANQSVNVAQFGGTNVVTGTGAGGSGIPRVTISNDSSLAANQSVNVAQVGGTAAAATAKGSQATNGIGVQDLKDAGRQQVLLSWEEMAGTAAAESALTNFTLGTRNATNLTAASSYTVSTGKTLRIQCVTIYLKSTSTAELLARYRIRQAASSIANNSPVIWDAVIALDAATVAATQGDQLAIPIPDGLEVAATQQITFTWFTSANTSTVGMSITGFEY